MWTCALIPSLSYLSCTLHVILVGLNEAVKLWLPDAGTSSPRHDFFYTPDHPKDTNGVTIQQMRPLPRTVASMKMHVYGLGQSTRMDTWQ
jgi:hypothetical protein